MPEASTEWRRAYGRWSAAPIDGRSWCLGNILTRIPRGAEARPPRIWMMALGRTELCSWGVPSEDSSGVHQLAIVPRRQSQTR